MPDRYVVAPSDYAFFLENYAYGRIQGVNGQNDLWPYERSTPLRPEKQMPTTSYNTRNEALSHASQQASPARSRRLSTALRLALPVVSFVLAACQPSVHSRQSITPAWNTVAGFVASSGPSRIRVGEYTVAGLRASAATRHWPLINSRTLSHRYGFDVQKDGGQQQGVQCV